MKYKQNTGIVGSDSYLQTAESVTEGHPDKLCDQISDAVLDAALEKDPFARVACEVAIGASMVVVMGEINNHSSLDIEDIVRNTIRDAGFTSPEYGFDLDKCPILIDVHDQAPEIFDAMQAVSNLSTDGPRPDVGPELPAQVGAGDQGIMYGFACNETREYLPVPIVLSSAICERLASVRRSGEIKGLRPDGKAQVTVEYSGYKPRRIHTVVVSAQHDPDRDLEELRAEIEEKVIKYVVQTTGIELLDDDTRLVINRSNFIEGGPGADAGLTGRKTMVDSYGGLARHGGGAFSGKDPTKVDRSAAYAARYVAKNMVAAGLARRLEIQLAYSIGALEPIHVTVDTFGTTSHRERTLKELVFAYFDLRPASIIEHLDLRRPIYRGTATYGHFGRSGLDRPWERLDMVDILHAAVDNWQA